MTYRPTHVLGVDQAKASGWAIAQVGGKVLECGLAKDHAARQFAVTRAMDAVQGVIDDLLVVFEDHSGFLLSYGSNRREDGGHQAPTRNTATILGLGAARGRWDETLDGFGHPEMLRIGVPPTDWRARVLGPAKGRGTDELKEVARRWAAAHLGRVVLDHNVAEAVCIAAWGARDGVMVLQHGRRERRVEMREKRDAAKQLGLWGKP